MDNNFFAGEIVTELLKQIIAITRKACSCRSTAQLLMKFIDDLLPIIQEIKYSGVELPQHRQSQLDCLSETLRGGQDLARKVLASKRWNLYKNLQLHRKMEKFLKTVTRFTELIMPAHLVADVHHLRFQTEERFDQLERSLGRLNLGGSGGEGQWVEEVARGVELMEEEGGCDSESLMMVGLELGKRKVKEMLIEREENLVVGICGIGGSGKTTLARHLCRDGEIRSYFDYRILILTVSQSPDIEQLQSKIWAFLVGKDNFRSKNVTTPWNLHRKQSLIVLDDVWSLSALERLIVRAPGCKTVVASRNKFPTVFNCIYEVELLSEEEAILLFCQHAFGQKSIPPGANESLVKQIVSECKALPLALKVIGSSLCHQSEMYWASAKKRLLRSEPISEAHENELLERMAISIECLPKKVKECFLDLASFPEDKRIPLDVLINIWVEIHDLDDLEAFAILVDLADKNLLTLVKDERAGDLYSGYYDISVTQHDVLRDLALYLSNQGDLNSRKRLLMPKRESELPKEWKRNSDQPFNAQIVSIHTGEMKEMDWCQLAFPKAEVLILNFSSNEYFLPPIIDDMPKLRALVVINYSSSNAALKNLSVFSNLSNLRSLWLEKVSITQLNESTVALKNLRKISLVLCKINNSLDQSAIDLPHVFPSLTELTIDHCDDLVKLPSSICRMHALECLNITNCHSLLELPADLGDLKSLEILRLYACPTLQTLPSSFCELVWLKFLDISQCVTLKCLPEGIGKLARLEKIDMRECFMFRDLPKSVASLKSMRRVVCDEDVSCEWNDLAKAIPQLHIMVAKRSFNLDWLHE